MRHTRALSLAVLLLAGCQSEPKSAPSTAAAPPHEDPHEEMKTEDAPAAPPASLRELMLAKTAWAGALLESISMQDYERVETNAEALRRVSEDSNFLVQDTVTYRAYSDAFRKAVAQLATDARAHNQSAIEADYHAVTESCFHCHAYVHQERLHGQMPGRVSLK